MDAGSDTPTISVDELRERLSRGEPLTVLDVRSSAARAEWSIPGSLHLDAYEALKANRPEDALAAVDLPRDKPVVTICNAGNTSRIAARYLRERGMDVVSLAGGMKAWSLAWNTAEVPVGGSAARVLQVRRTGKGCLSYVVGSGDTAAVIDPSLDPVIYLDVAERAGWKITAVLETHVHADHLSRARALAERSGADLRLPDQRRVSFPFTAVREGDSYRIGDARLTAIHVPGHTMESTGYLLDARALFTGDTLFLAGVGRPDLEADADETRARAHTLYRSLQRLLTLPAATLILPAHTNEPVPFDGRPLSAALSEVRRRVDLLAASEDEFVESILARIPPTPPNHHRIVELNEAGELPESDPTDLEVGANRCAVS